ncbi:MAG TPA: DUF6765 family protein [Steroidobacteraceae bacterium]|nr:DUF6765 family protein [Steroidobacteraceae bacterium]
MKGILCAGLLVSLQSMTVAQAYEADIHYSTTYVLARAVGWSDADALTIASANQAVDENQETVAALEMDTRASLSLAGYVASSLHQADKNLGLHCFSKAAGPAGPISPDVHEVMARHFARVPDGDEGAERHARRLIALGAALHCQQDAFSHVGFGGSCGSYSGSCYGHTYETFLDQVVFGLLKKHYYNPDHPGVSGKWLLEALLGTAGELSAHRPKASLRAIPRDELLALADELRASGLELPDDVRQECNRYIAGKWLFDFLVSANRTSHSAVTVEKLAPEIAGTCANASLGSATVVRIPEPRFPRLNPDASPRLVRADGTYQELPVGELDAALSRIRAGGIAALTPDYQTRKVKVQLSHWRQLLALPLMGQMTLASADGNLEAR